MVEPVDYGFVPEDGVAGLLDPVVFIGEVEQLAGDATSLEGVERGQALGFPAATEHSLTVAPRSFSEELLKRMSGSP